MPPESGGKLPHPEAFTIESMRWPFRLRLGPSEWTVRLHLFGPTLDMADGGSVAGGHTIRAVRAKSAAEARRMAIAAAESDLAKLLGRPLVEELFWSTEVVVDAAPDPADPVDRFLFYENVDQQIPKVILEFGEALSGNDLWLDLDAEGLSVKPEDDTQFGVSFCLEGEEYVVATSEWHGHYDDFEEAIACFLGLLSPYYRTVVESQGGARSASWIERWVADGWQPLGEVLYRNPTDPSKWLGGGWRREYRQQAMLRPPEPYDETAKGVRWDARGMPLGSAIGLRAQTFPRPYAEERGWLHADYDFDAG